MEGKKYRIKLASCDDEVEAKVELTAAEVAVIARVADAVNAKSYYCQIKMFIEELT